MTAVPTESPTRMASTPDSSTSRPKSASYAVITTSFSPFRLRWAKSRTVMGFCSGLALSNARAPQRSEFSQPKIAVRQFWMRYGESRLADGLLLEKDDVEIQSARSPPFGPDSAGSRFDSL